MSDWILTYTGRQFYPLAPRPEDVDIRDVAHALSNLCRFTGHGRKFLSVAEHSVGVSTLCREHPLWGLLHDAPEAYLGDLARPTKYALEGFGEAFRRAERRIMDAICERYDLDPVEPAEVKLIDNGILNAEADALMLPLPGGRSWVAGAPYVELLPRCWSPVVAETHFLERFTELTEAA